MQKQVTLFVPGRLCLAGEHSDWAATYRTEDSSVRRPGAALVVALQHGLHATATWTARDLILSSALAGHLVLSPPALLGCARSASPWRFAAAVAHLVHARYAEAGLHLRLTRASLPPARGLSSSAAICVLVARAFNQLYALHLTVAGEMDLAYAAERLTGSACGRMDQVVAVGPGNVIRMRFDGDFVQHQVLPAPRRAVHVVLADVGGEKDTRRILRALNKAFVSEGEGAQLREMLGDANLIMIEKMEDALQVGDARELGRLFVEVQRKFDAVAGPLCPEQLTAPRLHALLDDPELAMHVYGGKGVGSQGDGAVQFVALDEDNAALLKSKLERKLGNEPIIVRIGGDEPEQTTDDPPSSNLSGIPHKQQVRTAVIPTAGFGTRLFPASRSVRPKSLFPIVDADGFAKPLILYLVEQCADAGVKRVVIVVGPGHQEDRVREVFEPAPKDLYQALKPQMREYADRIVKLGALVEVVVQAEARGFGDAVACADVEEGCPFAVLLGDVAFRTHDLERSCLRQAIDSFNTNPSRSVVGVTRVPVAEAGAYGVVGTLKEDRSSLQRVPMQELVEKPDHARAEDLSWYDECSVILGPYVFTPTLMEELRGDVAKDRRHAGEIQLTPAMMSVLEKEGMDSLCLHGEVLDIGNAKEYVRTISRLSTRAT